jgi:hypothetical protein
LGNLVIKKIKKKGGATYGGHLLMKFVIKEKYLTFQYIKLLRIFFFIIL